MPKKKQLTQEEQQVKDICEEIGSDMTRTIVPALMNREDVVSVTVPNQLGMRAPRGTMLIVFADGTNVKARFTVDDMFAI